MKINKCNKLVCNLYDKNNYVIKIRGLKHAIKRVIQFNQKAWLKSYIDTNTKLRKEPKNNFQNDFFKLMNAVFEKTMENVRKHRDIKLVTPEKERGRLVLESNYHTTKQFFENLLAIEMKKKKQK